MKTGLNIQIGISNELFALLDTTLLTVLGQLSFMPVLVLASRICPEVRRGGIGQWGLRTSLGLSLHSQALPTGRGSDAVCHAYECIECWKLCGPGIGFWNDQTCWCIGNGLFTPARLGGGCHALWSGTALSVALHPRREFIHFRCAPCRCKREEGLVMGRWYLFLHQQV